MAIANISEDLTSLPCGDELSKVTRTLLRHPTLDACLTRINQALEAPNGHDVLLVAGPTGVGKTTLLSAVLASNLSKLSGEMPVISVEAHRGRTFASSFKTLLIDILKKTNPVLFDYGKASDPTGARPSFYGTALDKASVSRLLSMVSVSLHERKVRAVLVDEAQHLSPIGSQDDQLGLMADSLKDLGSHTNTVLVLFGCYDLLSLYDISGQLGRRSDLVHFSAYPLNSEGQTNFRKIVRSFCGIAPRLLPWESLQNKLPFLYSGCLGCTGVYEQWLVKAICDVMKSGNPVVTEEALRRTMRPVGNLKRMRAEIEAGEAKFSQLYSSPDDFMKELFGLPEPSGKEPTVKRDYPPGKRNPVRDTVPQL